MSIKISIIVPVYNVEKYIVDALESVIRQTIGLEHIEVIMVNDSSTDNSGKIIEEYAAKYDNFKAIHLPENSGAAGKPRNVGIENATGEYLMFLDPDDYYANDACEVLHEKIITEDADVVFGRFICLSDPPEISENLFGEKKEIIVNQIGEEPKLLEISPSVWTKIYKRNFVKNNNLEFPIGIPGQDLVFVAHSLLKATKIVYLNNNIIVHYRLREDFNKSISHKRNKKQILGLIEAYKQIYDIFKENDEYFTLILKHHLPHWGRHFFRSNLNSVERIEIMKKSEFFFRKYEEYGLIPNEKYLDFFFNLVINKEYEQALILIQSIIQLFKEKETLKYHIKVKTNEYEEFLENLKKKVSDSEERLNAKEQQLQSTEENLEKIKQLYFDILSSNSWKITKPFRILANSLKRSEK